MKQKKFFEHFNYVALFGVIGTLCCFVVFSALNYLIFEIFDFTQINPVTGESMPFKLLLKEILMMSAVMCSSDVVAAASIIKFDQ